MNVLHQNKKCLCPATSRSVESRLVLRDCANCAIGNGWQLQTGKLSFVVDTHTKPSCIAKSKQTKKLKLIGCEDSTNSKTAVIQSLAASVPQTKPVVVRTKSDEHLLVHTEQLVNYDFIFIA